MKSWLRVPLVLLFSAGEILTRFFSNLNNDALTELPLNVQGWRKLSPFVLACVRGIEGSNYDYHIGGSLCQIRGCDDRRYFSGVTDRGAYP